MDLDKRLGLMRGEPGAEPGAGHGVPLISDTTGVEHQRVAGIGGIDRPTRADRDETGLGVWREELSIGEQPRGALRRAIGRRCSDRPLGRGQRLVTVGIDINQRC